MPNILLSDDFSCFGSEMKTAPGRSYNCWLLIILQPWNAFIIRRPHRVLWNDVTDVINSPSKIHFTNFRGACLWLRWNMESSKSLDGKILDNTSWIWTNKSFLHSAMKPLWPVLVSHSFVSLSWQMNEGLSYVFMLLSRFLRAAWLIIIYKVNAFT